MPSMVNIWKAGGCMDLVETSATPKETHLQSSYKGRNIQYIIGVTSLICQLYQMLLKEKTDNIWRFDFFTLILHDEK